MLARVLLVAGVASVAAFGQAFTPWAGLGAGALFFTAAGFIAGRRSR